MKSLNNNWEEITKKFTPAVVELRVDYVRSFGYERPGNSVGTGFVVDKTLGLILTNRHIVSLGPLTANAVFSNKQRVKVFPIYRDPVHDFGFFKYNPSDLKYPELTEIILAPQEAIVGTEFRIIGSGEAEQNSIIPGTIASLTRKAPRYGSYWDFNTFYLAAVSNARQGSSGSPILSISGNAIALNCGGSANGSASFFLPLHRVVYALNQLRANSDYKVSRGTILCIFGHSSFDEVKDLGLSDAEEEFMRKTFKDATGLLAVTEVLPGGNADISGLKVGDILLSVNGQPLHEFLPLQEALDSCESLELKVCRNKENVQVIVPVRDLYSVTPSRYVEIGGGIVHEYGYMDAISRHIELGQGVFLSEPGYMFRHSYLKTGCIITEIKGRKVYNLDDFVDVMKSLFDKEKVVVKFFVKKNDEISRVVTIDRRWSLLSISELNTSGDWRTEEVTEVPPQPVIDGTIKVNNFTTSLEDALVYIEVRTPFAIEGGVFSKTSGTGVVVNGEKGLVVTSRRVAFSHLCDATISFKSLQQVEAKVVFLHPTYNMAFLQYNPLELQNVKVIRELVLSKKHNLSPGDRLTFLGLTGKEEKVIQQCTVTGKESPYFPECVPPRFMSRNEEFYVVDQTVSLYGSAGGLFGHRGENEVCAFWFGFNSSDPNAEAEYKVVSAQLVLDAADFVLSELSKEKPDLSIASVGVSLQTIQIAKVREALKLDQDWVEKLQAAGRGETNQILQIRKVMTASEPAKILQQGDFVLSVNDKTVASFSDFEDSIKGDSVDIKVVRNSTVLDLKNVKTEKLLGFKIDRVVFVNGLVIHETFDAVRYGGFLPTGTNVYITNIWAGSPARRGKFYYNGWISAINGKPVSTIETFLENILDTENGEYLNYEVIALNGSKQVLAVQNDFCFFKPVQFLFQNGEWKLQNLQ